MEVEVEAKTNRDHTGERPFSGRRLGDLAKPLNLILNLSYDWLGTTFPGLPGNTRPVIVFSY